MHLNVIRLAALVALSVSLSQCSVDYIISNASSVCPIAECYTLCEWIATKSQSLSQITEVILLPGIHILSDLEGDIMSINETDSFSLTGNVPDDGNMPTVVCAQNYHFVFSTLTIVHISKIKFIDCVVLTVYISDDYSESEQDFVKRTTFLPTTFYYESCGNITIEDVIIDQGGITIDDQIPTMHSVPINSAIVLSNLKIEQEGISLFLIADKHRSFSRQIFVTRTMFAKSCVRFEGTASYNIIIEDLTIDEAVCNHTVPVLYLDSLNKVTIGNLSIMNCRYPLMSAKEIHSVMEQKGLWRFHHNTGGGVTVQVNFEVCSRSIIEFINNTVRSRENLFEFSAVINSAPVRINIHDSVIKFKDNLVENNGLFVMKSLQIFTMDRYSHIMFENNRCGTKLNANSGVDFSEAGVMMLSDIYAYLNNLTFTNNTAPLSGGITAVGSAMTFGALAVIEFNSNKGGDGGGMAMYNKAQIISETYYYWQHVHFVFTRNTATNRGGGIYVEDIDYFNPFSNIRYDKFFAPSSTTESIRITFTENNAMHGGNDLYGGWIDLEKQEDHFKTIKFDVPQDDLHSVASGPTRICVCINSIPMCNLTTHYIYDALPGHIINVPVVAVGQRQGIIASLVLANILGGTGGKLNEAQRIQNVNKECTFLQYTIFSSNEEEQLSLVPEKRVKVPLSEDALQEYPDIRLLFEVLKIIFKLNSCPPGFTLDLSVKSCNCEKSLIDYGLQCNLDTFTVIRKEQAWVSATYNNLRQNSNHGVIVHKHCPYDYCKTDYESLTLHLNYPDSQCNNNRTGILCGQCEAGLSHLLGSSSCKECSNLWLLALIPGVLVAGIVLTFLLMMLNLTVSTGTLSGLIFYANIIRASSSTYFSNTTSNSFVGRFIAWLNLDLGIEMCLFNGLDSYTKSWLQFFFPLYLWILVVTIIVASHYSTTASRLSGNNAVQVLATLVLLSYTKLVRVIITTFSYTIIEYPNGLESRVWLYDGNVKFLHGKHTIIFIFSLFMLLFALMPYTVILGTIQWLQKITHLNVINKFKPFVDAYAGPYRDKHRYWVGLLLMIRVLFLLIFTLNRSNNPSYNLLSVTIVAVGLMAFLSSTGGVYKNWILNVIESFSLMNLALLSVGLLFELSEYGTTKTPIFTYVSTSIAVFQFVITVAYHLFLRLIDTKVGKKFKITVITAFAKQSGQKIQLKTPDVQSHSTNASSELTHTSIELHKPLL